MLGLGAGGCTLVLVLLCVVLGVLAQMGEDTQDSAGTGGDRRTPTATRRSTATVPAPSATSVLGPYNTAPAATEEVEEVPATRAPT